MRGTAALLLGVLVSACGSSSPGPTDASVDAPMALPPTYANVTALLTRSCTFSSCHGGAGGGQAHLNLQRSITNGTLVADLMTPACEYGAMPLLDPGHPENSWLFVKVAGAHSTGTAIDFTPAASWDHGGLTPDAMGRYPVSTCPLVLMGQISFGEIMPQGTMGVTASEAEMLRAWIAAGAPGP
jgi:hypothetical protein